MNGIIYKATNRYNGYIYIGQTRATLARRIQQHFRDAKSDSNLFHLALLQYGKEGFEWETVDEFSGTKEEVIHALNVAEEYHILKNKSMLGDRGYNATQGGYSSDKFADVIKRRAQANYGGTPILQYDLDGNFLREFDSIADVRRFFGVREHKGKHFLGKTWRGFQWREKMNNLFPKKISAHIPYRQTKQKVLCYSLSGEFYRVFQSIKEAHKELGAQSNIKEFSDVVELKSSIKSGFILMKFVEDAPKQITIIKKEKRSKTTNSPKPSTSYSVIQYSRDGEFIAEYPSLVAANKETGINKDTIRSSCKKCLPLLVTPSTKFLWRKKSEETPRFIEVYSTEKKKEKYTRTMEHRVIQCDKEGNIIKIWDSMYQASLQTGESHNLIRKQCMGIPTKKKTPSIWKYYTDSQVAI